MEYLKESKRTPSEFRANEGTRRRKREMTLHQKLIFWVLKLMVS
jgi:hypothetical protein